MEKMKFTCIREKGTDNTYNLRAIDSCIVEVTVIKGTLEFSFRLNTQDIKSLANHMTDFANEMEAERLTSLQRRFGW